MLGRQKGSRAELEVAADLQAWWRKADRAALFVRTPLSGGWGQPQHREGFKTSGDLMTTSEIFSWVVEVKRREGWSWSMLLAAKKSPVWGWWLQTENAAKEQKGTPVLFLRHNREEWSVMLPYGYMLALAYELKPMQAWNFDQMRVYPFQFLPALYSWEALKKINPTRFARPVAKSA